MPDTQVNVSGVEKDVAGQIWINVAGTWKEALNLVTTTNRPVNGFVTSPGTSTAGLRFNSDGTKDTNIDGAYSQSGASTDWIVPNGFASADYDIRYTALTGDALTSAPAAENVWIDLGSDRLFAVSRSSIGVSTSTLTIEIRGPDGTTLDTCTQTFTAEVDSGA
jgi:hypothetical protein